MPLVVVTVMVDDVDDEPTVEIFWLEASVVSPEAVSAVTESFALNV
jgi:hypothetical protein